MSSCTQKKNLLNDFRFLNKRVDIILISLMTSEPYSMKLLKSVRKVVRKNRFNILIEINLVENFSQILGLGLNPEFFHSQTARPKSVQ